MERGTVPTPEEMAQLEPVVWPRRSFVHVSVGDRFGDTFFSATEFKVAQMATKFAPGAQNYLLAYKPDKALRPSTLSIMCVLREHATINDVLRAHFHGMVVAHAFATSDVDGGGGGIGGLDRPGSIGVLHQHARELRGTRRDDKQHTLGHGWGEVMRSSASTCGRHGRPICSIPPASLHHHSPRLHPSASADYCEEKFKDFQEVCTAAGWNLSRAQLSVGPYRSQWTELMEVLD